MFSRGVILLIFLGVLVCLVLWVWFVWLLGFFFVFSFRDGLLGVEYLVYKYLNSLENLFKCWVSILDLIGLK